MSMDLPSKINFFKGHPTFSLLPRKEIINATTQLLTPTIRSYDDQTENRHPLTYGSDEGAYWVRDEIAKFNNCKIFQFDKNAKCRTKAEYLNLTSGASYGILSILLQTTLAHTNYTRQAFIISPTYFLINDCFIDAGFSGKLTAINEIKNGNTIDFDYLESKLKYFDSIDSKIDGKLNCISNPTRPGNKKIFKYVLYCVPTFSNPSGMTFSLETKTKLIELARKYDMLIIADDVYDVLNYEEPLDKLPLTPTRFVHLDRETNLDPNSYGNTISNSTFSKIIAPGLRFGYQETINSMLAHQLSEGGANRSGGTPSQLNSMIIGTLLQNGDAERIIKNLRMIYTSRSVKLYNSIKKWLPSDTCCELVKGGYFSWVTLPEGYNCKEIESILKSKYQVIMANGSEFEVIEDEKNWGDRSVRLSISFLEEDQIEEGIRLWGQVCKAYAKQYNLPF